MVKKAQRVAITLFVVSAVLVLLFAWATRDQVAPEDAPQADTVVESIEEPAKDPEPTVVVESAENLVEVVEEELPPPPLTAEEVAEFDPASHLDLEGLEAHAVVETRVLPYAEDFSRKIVSRLIDLESREELYVSRSIVRFSREEGWHLERRQSLYGNRIQVLFRNPREVQAAYEWAADNGARILRKDAQERLAEIELETDRIALDTVDEAISNYATVTGVAGAQPVQIESDWPPADG